MPSYFDSNIPGRITKNTYWLEICIDNIETQNSFTWDHLHIHHSDNLVSPIKMLFILVLFRQTDILNPIIISSKVQGWIWVKSIKISVFTGTNWDSVHKKRLFQCYAFDKWNDTNKKPGPFLINKSDSIFDVLLTFMHNFLKFWVANAKMKHKI